MCPLGFSMIQEERIESSERRRNKTKTTKQNKTATTKPKQTKDFEGYSIINLLCISLL